MREKKMRMRDADAGWMRMRDAVPASFKYEYTIFPSVFLKVMHTLPRASRHAHPPTPAMHIPP